MILLLDNYDSFVYNLDRYLRRLGQKTLVIRSDAIGVEAIVRLGCSAIVLSPQVPKSPDDAVAPWKSSVDSTANYQS